MKAKIHSRSCFLGWRFVYTLPFCAAASSILVGTLLLSVRSDVQARVSHRTLTFAERVAYQRAIEEVYWRHRIWPRSGGERLDPKPSLDAVMHQEQLEKKVADYLRKSRALEDYWQRPITAEQLQAEMDRMARDTKQPAVLRELFEALGNDPAVIAECLARPILAEGLIADFSAQGETQRFESPRTENLGTMSVATTLGQVVYTLPTIADAGDPPCTDDTWTATATFHAPTARSLHTAVWTGSEMIIWGGGNNTGGRYNPSTDSWTATSTSNAPTARSSHTAVWTGSEMIVWGATLDTTGGRYNPSTDSWTATSTSNAPAARSGHTAVWTGSEMIVWGGFAGTNFVNTGGRYNPSTDTWTATSTANAPSPLLGGHTAVWTGSEMIVWGEISGRGGRYNPTTDAWTPTSITNAPVAGLRHTAVWSGSEMIVWGGGHLVGGEHLILLNTGGRYNPSTDTWTATSTTNAPAGRWFHTAIWSGSEMIVWGGRGPGLTNTGGRYNPGTDSWTTTTTANAPSGRVAHTAVWTDSEMIVWGGYDDSGTPSLNTGGRYCGAEAPGRLGNISTRAFVEMGDNVEIGGFIVQGTEPKRIIIRAIGPELTQYGVPNVLVDPTLELHEGTGALIASNDNWQHTIIGGIITSDQVRDIMATRLAPRDPRESAIIANLPAGNYTAIVRGVNNTTGVALVEAYELSPDSNSFLGNISTRAFVQTGDNVMIGGFIVQGAQLKRVIIRAIGPELTQYGIPNALSDPTLELHDGTGALIASNDNWQHTIIGGIITGDQVRDIINTRLAPRDPRESAIIADLPSGNYTAIMRGVDNTTGVALVEVYDLDQ
jgi:N-acetylneuraminic acid mutarotase